MWEVMGGGGGGRWDQKGDKPRDKQQEGRSRESAREPAGGPHSPGDGDGPAVWVSLGLHRKERLG